MSNLIVLDMEHPAIQHLCKKDRRLAKVIKMVGPISYVPHTEDAYSFLIHEIIEQMLSVKAGQKIFNRLERLCGGKITPDCISILSDNEIKSIGTSNAKVQYIRSITNAVIDGSLDFEKMNMLGDADVMKELTKIRGIGNWTAKMYLMFVLDRPNIIPVEDVAFLQVYKWIYKTKDCSKEAVYRKCKKWSPYSTIASRYFYHALDGGMTKEEFHLYK